MYPTHYFIRKNHIVLNVKSLFGIILTLVGLTGLIYWGIDFTNGRVAQASFVYLILEGILFFTDTNLIRSTKARHT